MQDDPDPSAPCLSIGHLRLLAMRVAFYKLIDLIRKADLRHGLGRFLAFVERDGDSVSEIGLTSLLLGRIGLSLRRVLADSPRRFQGVEDLPLSG